MGWLHDPAVSGDKERAVERIEKLLRSDESSLDLSGLRLSEFPPIDVLKGRIKDLSLKNNKLTTLPREIGDFNSLVGLDISENELTVLPQEIGKLTRLCQFFFHRNPNLTKLPMDLGNILGIDCLDISDTQVDDQMVTALYEGKQLLHVNFVIRSSWILL